MNKGVSEVFTLQDNSPKPPPSLSEENLIHFAHEAELNQNYQLAARYYQVSPPLYLLYHVTCLHQPQHRLYFPLIFQPIRKLLFVSRSCFHQPQHRFYFPLMFQPITKLLFVSRSCFHQPQHRLYFPLIFQPITKLLFVSRSCFHQPQHCLYFYQS